MSRGSIIHVNEHSLARTTGQAIGSSFTVDSPSILSGTAVFSTGAKLTLTQTIGATAIVGAFNADANLAAGVPFNFTHVLHPGVTYQLKTTGATVTVTVAAHSTIGAALGS